MNRIDLLFLRVGVVYVVAGMVMGIAMAMTDDHSLTPAHAHMNLLGWASMGLYALVYRAWPAAARSRLAPWHFWSANLGTLMLVAGVAGVYSGAAGFVPLAAAGSFVALASMLLFAGIVFTLPRADPA